MSQKKEQEKEKKQENKQIEVPYKPNKIFLTPNILAARWKMTSEALNQWRWNGKTPPYLKMGKKILYDLEEIERFEAQKVRHNTSQQGSSPKEQSYFLSPNREGHKE